MYEAAGVRGRVNNQDNYNKTKGVRGVNNAKMIMTGKTKHKIT